MKMQIAYLSPHQNGKVLGVIAAVTCLVLLVPILLLISVMAPESENALPLVGVLLFPVLYLVMTYLMVALSGAVYNVIVRHTGGIEYVSAEPPTLS